MNKNDLKTKVLYYQNEEWIEMESPKFDESVSITILFNTFNIIDSSSYLVTLGYHSESGSLNDEEVKFYVISYSLENLSQPPTVIQIWEKTCETASKKGLVFPSIDTIKDSVIVASPESACPNNYSIIKFYVLNGNLEMLNSTIPSIPNLISPYYFQAESKSQLYISDGDNVYMLHSGNWEVLIDNVKISALYSSEDRIYVAYHNGYEQSVQYYSFGSFSGNRLFTGGIYKSGSILSSAEMSDDKFMIGGDFKYIVDSNNNLINAKFAALYDAGHWKATLESNANNYLPGWRLLSISAIGGTVFGIAYPGDHETEDLPIIRWREDDGWLFLYNRPTLVTNNEIPWDKNVGTVYIDRSREQVYFGGQFTVQLPSGQQCSGGFVYKYHEESWTPLPANLTRINAFDTLNNHEYLQIGGSFSFLDENSIRHDNYLIIDIEEQQVLSSVPFISNGEVFSMSLFPNQPIYSYIGGNFNQYGVEQLKFFSNVWSLSVVGNNPLNPTVYSLASRNEGESLFAGGSFSSHLSKLDIGRQEWHDLIPSSFSWYGDVRTLLLICPGDVDYYTVDSNWDDSSLLGSFYSVPDCTIPLGAPDDYICPTPSLTGGQIFGLCFTVLVTLIIIGVIGFFVFKVVKAQKEAEKSVEYI